MASPSVKELPKSGARLSRPNTFSTDAEIFLSELPTFRVQVNQLSSYTLYQNHPLSLLAQVSVDNLVQHHYCKQTKLIKGVIAS